MSPIGCKNKLELTEYETLLKTVGEWHLVQNSIKKGIYLLHNNSTDMYDESCVDCGEKAPELLFNLLKLLNEDI